MAGSQVTGRTGLDIESLEASLLTATVTALLWRSSTMCHALYSRRRVSGAVDEAGKLVSRSSLPNAVMVFTKPPVKSEIGGTHPRPRIGDMRSGLVSCRHP